MTCLVARHARHADLSEPPLETRGQRTRSPSPSLHRLTRLTAHAASGWSGIARESPRRRRASSERGAGARDLLSKPACRRMHGYSETFPAVGMAALPPLTGPNG